MSTDYSHTIVGVLDIRDGQVVRAIAGARSHYQRWESSLTNSADPLETARAFRRHYRIDQLYLADLDALEGKAASWPIVPDLLADGFHLTLDAGPRQHEDIERALAAGVHTVVIPLETLPHRSTLAQWARRFDPRHLAFGLDLAAGLPLAEPAVWHGDGMNAAGGEQLTWSSDAPLRIARDVVAIGIPHLIVLDLRNVGAQTGPTTSKLCAQIRQACPNAILWTGGGVRNTADIDRLHAAGANRVLAASLLHEGKIGIAPA